MGELRVVFALSGNGLFTPQPETVNELSRRRKAITISSRRYQTRYRVTQLLHLENDMKRHREYTKYQNVIQFNNRKNQPNKVEKKLIIFIFILYVYIKKRYVIGMFIIMKSVY